MNTQHIYDPTKTCPTRPLATSSGKVGFMIFVSYLNVVGKVVRSCAVFVQGTLMSAGFGF